jgi:hypothetical protein
VGLTVLERAAGDAPWIASTLTGGETLRMPEVGIEAPVDELYEDVELAAR